MRHLPLLGVLLVTALVFGAVAGHSLLMWDDDVFLYENPLLRAPGWPSVRAAWTAPYADLYTPVPLTIWIGLTRLCGGPAPGTEYWSRGAAVYHLANLATHLLAVGLAYWLLYLLTKRPWPAAAGAALFALHPLQVETVAWASELKDLLGGAGGLLALCLLVRGQKSTSGRSWWAAGATVAFALALLSKPSLVVLPLLALVVGLGLSPSVRFMCRVGLVWLGLAVVYAGVVHRFQAAAPAVAVAPGLRLLVAGDALAFYLGKLVWPIHLGADHGRTPGVVLQHWWGYVTWLVPAAVLGLGFALRRRAAWVLPAVLWFMLSLLPVLGLVPFDFQQYSTVADHYAYLALVGPALALAGLCLRLRPSLVRTPVLLVLLLLAVQSSLQTLNWQSNLIFWQHTLAVNARSFPAHDNLGTVYHAIGQLPQATEQYEAALALRPGSPALLFKLGLLELDRGRPGRAAEYLRRGLALEPANPEARHALAEATARAASGAGQSP